MDFWTGWFIGTFLSNLIWVVATVSGWPSRATLDGWNVRLHWWLERQLQRIRR